jgi:dipeptidase
MLPEIQAVQQELEGSLTSIQPAIEEKAIRLLKKDPQAVEKYLSEYSVSQGELVVKRWRELGEYLICNYNDGYIKDEKSQPQEKGIRRAGCDGC